VSAVRAKRSEYAVAVDAAGRLSVEGGAPVSLADGWTSEHLLLAGVARCSLASLAYHARRSSIDLRATASATGAVARREEDGRYAFVEVHCRIDVELDPVPPGEELTALIAKAERGCFVGASLTAAPTYAWRVNGEDVA
jgi:organic hydroperoxide reductase OsmC/OhrA